MENEMLNSEMCPAYSARLVLDYDRIEQAIIRGYVRLLFTPREQCGSRTTTVIRFGDTEVRLTELSRDRTNGSKPFLLEIYSHALLVTIGRRACFDLNEPELASAVEFVEHATRTHVHSLLLHLHD
jgi:hypothetical protein